MPGRSGLDLAAEIKRLHPDVPVILTSGYSHVLAESGSNEVDLLHKPYSIDQLSAALRSALTRRRVS
jgi:DNA-binding NtrC family response regulator